METDATLWSSPENRGKCGFCGKEENGYAKQKDGKWVAACWKCIRPASAGAAQPKRNPVGTVFTQKDEDLDERPQPTVKKSPGMAPSTHRPAVR